MKTLRPLLATLLLLGAPVIAQAQDESAAVNTSRMLWEQLIGWITASAEDVPEAAYAFRPTPEVRSLGQLFAHVAGAQYLICGAAMGEPPSDENNIEKTRTSKADIVAALKASTEYCARAYQQTDKAAQQSTRLFGQQQTRLYALILNATHDGEHYGNMVTYMRLNGIVPPSSRRN